MIGLSERCGHAILPPLSAQSPRQSWRNPVTLRLAEPGDEIAIARLAERDSRAAPAAPRLVAERRGRLEAAISLTSGEAVADPFVRTAELIELLRRARSRA